MHPLGASTPLDGDTWTLKTTALKATQPSAKAKGVPAGWLAATTDLVFTNTSDEIQSLPTVSVTGRYGGEGRPIESFTDAGIAPVPAPALGEEPRRVGPGQAVTARLGVAVPSDAAGQPVTFTVQSQAYLRMDETVHYFEGRFPGRPAQPTPLTGTATMGKKGLLRLGDWNDDGVSRIRLSRLSTCDLKGGRRECTIQLTVLNTRPQVEEIGRTRLDNTLRIYYGATLQGPVVVPEGPGADRYDGGGPIAPQRAATQTLRFALPPKAVPGPLTIEVTYPHGGGTRATYQAQVGG
ncbi:hypothetical protein [Streptomyces sp. NPDC127084]|uniref:hypothetical protein n=1 Tax=Streptomyces sp. NPDC127084 TaxID=3347133 RepID=UPI00365C3D1A